MSLSRSLTGCCRMMALASRRSFHVAASLNKRVLVPRECASFVSPAAKFSTQTKGDEELSNFLSDEIKAEKGACKHSTPPKVEGFDISCNDSDVKMTRRFNNETITVSFNVNHSVDAEENENFDQQSTTPSTDPGEMVSKPTFDVVIEKSGQKLHLSCTFAVDQHSEQDDFNDVFQIVEFSSYSGEEVKDSDYSVSGDIMDGQLYDLLMNMLEERGVTNEFAQQLIDFSTSYEHKLYINLLEKLQNFVAK